MKNLCLLKPFDQVEIRKQTRIPIDIGSTVLAEHDVGQIAESRSVCRGQFFEELSLSRHDVQAIDLYRDLFPSAYVHEFRIVGPAESFTRQQTGNWLGLPPIDRIQAAFLGGEICARNQLAIGRDMA